MKSSSTVIGTASPLRGRQAAVESLDRGGLVIVVHDDGVQYRADLVARADTVDGRQMAEIITHTSGLVCAAMSDTRAAELELPRMPAATADGDSARRFSVAVDAAEGVTTGISASDRAHTLNILAASDSRPEQLTRPGHVMVLRADPAGRGPAAAALRLCRMAGPPGSAVVAVVAPVMFEDNNSAANRAHVRSLSALLQIPIVDSADIRRGSVRAGSDGHWELTVLEDGSDVLCIRAFGGIVRSTTPLIGLRGRCLDAELSGSADCPCSRELGAWISAIEQHGSGAIVQYRDDHRRCEDRSAAAVLRKQHEEIRCVMQLLGGDDYRLLRSEPIHHRVSDFDTGFEVA